MEQGGFSSAGTSISSQLCGRRGVSAEVAIRQLEIVSWKPAAFLFPALLLRG